MKFRPFFSPLFFILGGAAFLPAVDAADLLYNTGATQTLTGTVSYDNVRVGVNGGTTATIVDASAATWTSSGTEFYVGVEANNTATSVGTLKLGDSTITVTGTGAMAIGGSWPNRNGRSSNGGRLEIAAGKTATILTPNLWIGGSKCVTVFSAEAYFKLGSGATVNLGNATNRTSVLIASNTGGDMQGKTWKGNMDLSLGNGTLYLNSLTLAKNGFGGDNAHLTGDLKFGSGSNVLNISGGANPVKIGYSNLGATSAYTTTGNLTMGNLNEGSIIESTDDSTAIVVAYKAGLGGVVNGNLFMNGGTLTIKTTGTAIGDGGGNSALVLGNAAGNGTGMTLKAGASSVGGAKWITGLDSAKIKTTGVTFDTAGYDIAIDQALLADTTDAGGGLTKANGGILNLSGANTYTGTTTISGGTLTLSGAGTLGSGGGLTLSGGQLDLGTLSRSVGAVSVTTAASSGDTIKNGSLTGTSYAASNSTGNAIISANLVANGAAGLTKSGAGTLTLSGSNSYSGATQVNNGTLVIDGAGSINSTSSITVAAAGKFVYNSSTALTKAVTLSGSGTGGSQRAILSGTGSIGVDLGLNQVGDVLSPGNSPGVQTFTVAQNWSSFSYDWEVKDFTGTEAGTVYDQIAISAAIDGTLNLSGGAGSYILNVLSLDSLNKPGDASNFSEMSRSWNILTTTHGINGFDADFWTINTGGFTNGGTGTWSLDTSGNNLVLYYTVPEPAAALLGGLGLLFLLRRRR